MPATSDDIERVRGLLPGLLELAPRDDGLFDLLVGSALRGQPDIAWRSGVTLATAESLANRMPDGEDGEGDIRFFRVGLGGGPRFDFADPADDADAATLRENEAMRRDVREQVRQGLRVPGWWACDDPEEDRAEAVALAIAEASEVAGLAFDPHALDAIERLGDSALDVGFGVYAVEFVVQASEGGERDPLVRLNLIIEELDGDEEDDG